MQKLSIQLTISIPDEYVVVSRVELDKLSENELTGVYWTMQDLEERVGKKTDGIKDNILYPSRFRKELDAENGGFVYYPKVKGQSWSFQAVKMAKFLDSNFEQIFRAER